MKKDLAIVLFSNKKYFLILGTFIVNIKTKFNYYDSTVVVNEDLSENHKQILLSFDEKIIFKNYSIDNFTSDFKFDKKEILNIHEIERYTCLTAIKHKILELLDFYKIVIYFDIDMLLLSDISELLSGNYNIAWRSDNTTIKRKVDLYNTKSFKLFSTDIIANYDKYITPNGGFFILKDNFDYDYALKLSNEFFYKSFLFNPTCIDEITFSYFSNELQLVIKCLDKNIYNTTPKNVNSQTKLIHFYKDNKPWKNEESLLKYPIWSEYNTKFLKFIKKCFPNTLYI